ncbi:MAG: type II toxin-antitoxin system VapC family toxin [Gammaproteobacteria bacterium]
MLLDSNVFIYAVLPEYGKLRQWCSKQNICASEITRLEVLGYHRLVDKDRDDFSKLFDLATIFSVSSVVIESAISLRQKKKMSLADAIIAATALEHRQTLVTRNTKDFDWIEGLKLTDPISDL